MIIHSSKIAAENWRSKSHKVPLKSRYRRVRIHALTTLLGLYFYALIKLITFYYLIQKYTVNYLLDDRYLDMPAHSWVLLIQLLNRAMFGHKKR